VPTLLFRASVLLLSLCLVTPAALGQGPLPNSPYRMNISQLPSGHQTGVGTNPSDWIKFADPFGVFGKENGITDGEAAQFSSDSAHIVTSNKADGRYINTGTTPPDGTVTQNNRYEWDFGNRPTMATARLRVWNATTGALVWEKHRSRGPDNNGDFRPDNQPGDFEDEIEIAAFSPDDRYIAAGGEDDKVEIWRFKNPAGGFFDDAEPVASFSTAAGVDGMTYSHSGDLVFAGTENAGEVEVIRVQGDPGTWQELGTCQHGGGAGNAVNSLDITQDDKYLATHGTNREGVFWKLDVTRDGTGLITGVNMTKIATLGDTSDFEGSGREARFSNDGGPDGSGETYLTLTNEKDFLTRIYKVEDLKNYTGPHNDQNQVPQPFRELKNGSKNAGTTPALGTEIEPSDFTKSGRFFISDGDSRDGSGNPNGQVFPGFFRVYETAEWADKPADQEPDPIWVQRALSTEFLNFNPDDTRLASGQGDGTLRVWDVTITAARTIHSEGFNEPTADGHGRWTLAGSLSTPGDNEWGTSDGVTQDTVFVGDRGRHYVAVDNLVGETHTLTLAATWDISGFEKRQVQFAAAAAPGAFEAGDFLRLKADTDGDGTFETTIAQFLPDSDGDLAFSGTGQKLNSLFEDDAGADYFAFQDFFVDLEPLLPQNFNGSIRFLIEANTNSSAEEIGFDSLRVTGAAVVPEPHGAALSVFALLVLSCLTMRRGANSS